MWSDRTKVQHVAVTPRERRVSRNAMADTTDVPFGLVARILWAEVKTADADAPDFYEWIKGYSIGGIVEARIDVLTLLAESIQTVKKPKAAAIRERIWRRLTFWRMRRNAD